MDYDDFTSFVELSYRVLNVDDIWKLCETDLLGCMWWASKYKTDAAKINLQNLKVEYAIRGQYD